MKHVIIFGWTLLWIPLASAQTQSAFTPEHRMVAGGGLTGNYTVGGAGANYLNLADALDAVMLEGLAGPVQLQLLPGIHEVHVTLTAFDRWDNPDDWLSIESEDPMSPATLQHDATDASDNWSIRLDGVHHVQLKDLVLEATGSADYASLVAIEEGSHDITIWQNQFIAYDINPSFDEADGSSVVNLSPSGIADIVISDNVFDGGNMAIYLSGTSVLPINGVTVTHNRFNEQRAIGSFNVVYFNYVDALNFSHNTINNLRSNAKGLRVNHSDGGTIDANQVNMLGGGNGGIGMRLSSLNGTDSSSTTITNNTIVASNKGLVLDNLSQNVAVLHNTIVADGSIASVLSYGIQINTTDGADIELKNNLISSTMTHDEALIFSYPSALAFSAVDDNVYHGLSLDPYMYDGLTYANFNDYQTASGLDPAALEKQVDYVDVAAGDLHLANSQYNDADLLIPAAPGVYFDVDGETRLPSASHKGADDLNAEWIFVNGFE